MICFFYYLKLRSWRDHRFKNKIHTFVALTGHFKRKKIFLKANFLLFNASDMQAKCIDKQCDICGTISKLKGVYNFLSTFALAHVTQAK